MPSIPIIMPQLGESIAEATVVNLLVKVGDPVRTDQDLMEVETSKATMNVASPCTGRVDKLLIKLNESYPVGTVLGFLEASQEEAVRLGLDSPNEAENGNGSSEPGRELKMHGDNPKRTVEPTVGGLPVPANATGASYMSPRLKARMIELGLHAADLAGLPGFRKIYC
jgi:pyruvate/2-oxoglutarate dehydrogenase complex dihydrolipoamide acyltransferase (E2) component